MERAEERDACMIPLGITAIGRVIFICTRAFGSKTACQMGIFCFLFLCRFYCPTPFLEGERIESRISLRLRGRELVDRLGCMIILGGGRDGCSETERERLLDV